MAAVAEAEARPPETTPPTPETLLTEPGLELFELVDGKLAEKKMGYESSLVGSELLRRLSNYVMEHGLGYVAGADAGFQCFAEDPRRVRKPDVSFLRKGRLKGGAPRGHVPIVPDLAVEVVSPNDTYSEVTKKIKEYRRARAPLVWVIDPASRSASVYRSDGSMDIRDENAELSGEDVVPGFTCRVADLFLPLEVSE